MVGALRLMAESCRPRVERVLRNLAAQDVCCLTYHGYMLARVALAPDQVMAQRAMPLLLFLFAATGLTILLVRGELLPAGQLRAIVYRLGIMVPIILGYLPLRYALPALGVPLRDTLLQSVDVLLFGETPAVWLERYVNTQSVEWFAFFYYSYFTLVFLHVFGSAFFDRGRRAAELLFGALIVCCMGHGLYTLSPGVGPYAAIAFRTPLHGGFFFTLVLKTVSASGAMLDIFPSLHTAYPTLFTLHSLRHRNTLPYRYTAPIMAFFTLNIVIATLFLRWHYAIDVFAGLCLALLAQRLGILSAYHESDDVRGDRQLVWEPLRSGRSGESALISGAVQQPARSLTSDRR